jgi:hypothetical protein
MLLETAFSSIYRQNGFIACIFVWQGLLVFMHSYGEATQHL